MNYLINNHINYDSHQGLLYIDDVNNALKLTTTLNRLLLVLVQNNHDIVDRETILRRVWEEHNQVVSDNNLNSSVSVLRRHLSSFSDDEIITTVPKVGIKFSADLKIENEQQEISDNNHKALFTSEEELDSSSKVPEGTFPQAVENKKSYMLNNRYVEISLIGLIIFAYYTFLKVISLQAEQNTLKLVVSINAVSATLIVTINPIQQPSALRQFKMNSRN
ncbi:DNA-binding transcriptional regulator BaeR [Providencia rettgeri]|nr:DNA-binding transcriptional regulator BaeR [Providencia rettgeri]